MASSGATASAAGGAGAGARRGTWSGWLASWFTVQTVLFVLNLWVVVNTVLYVLVSGNLLWAVPRFKAALAGSILGNLVRLWAVVGKPPSWTLEDLKAWSARVAPRDELQQLMFAFLFFAARYPVTLALVPHACSSTFKTAVFVERHTRGGRPARGRLAAAANRSAAGLLKRRADIEVPLNTVAEIGCGFAALIGIALKKFTLVSAFLTWQHLRGRYQISAPHRQTWRVLGERFDAVIDHRYFPSALAALIRRALAPLIRIFTTGPGTAAAQAHRAR